MQLEVGQLIDAKYRITRLIGEGGMGAVFEGENTLIRRKVAIKVLLAATSTNAELIRRFEREAQAAGEIGSDHILEVLDLGTLPTGERYMVMEYLDGETLTDRVRTRGRLAPRQAAFLAQQLLTGLASAHAAGIIHRDLKPDNVFILKEKAGQRDFVKLIDFGISKFSRLNTEPLNVTRIGSVMGTPCYMSPEQARGSSEADVRSDIYAVGVILYETVTGQLPFDGDSFNDLMFKIALSDAAPPSSINPDVDAAFEAIVMKAMARDPTERYASVSELKAALDAWLAGTDGERAGEGSIGDPASVSTTSARSQPGIVRMGAADTITADGLNGPPKTRGNWAKSGTTPAPRGRRTLVTIASAILVASLVAGGTIAAVKLARPTRAAVVSAPSAGPNAASPIPETAVPATPTTSSASGTGSPPTDGATQPSVKATSGPRARPPLSPARPSSPAATAKPVKPAASAKPHGTAGGTDFGY